MWLTSSCLKGPFWGCFSAGRVVKRALMPFSKLIFFEVVPGLKGIVCFLVNGSPIGSSVLMSADKLMVGLGMTTLHSGVGLDEKGASVRSLVITSLTLVDGGRRLTAFRVSGLVMIGRSVC